MADCTAIEWTDATWNPVRGCTRVSEACRFCYAEGVAARFSGEGQPYHGFADRGRPGSKWTGKVEVIWPLIGLPLRWHRPRRIFVNSMSDLFHETLPMEEIATIFAIMVAAVHLRGHTFQVLTKRAARMRAILTDPAFWEQVNAEAGMHVLHGTDPMNRRSNDARATLEEYGPDNPPPGVWLGVSVEDQPAADERIHDLAATPATVRFLSCEPLLSRIETPFLTMHLGAFSNWRTGGAIHWVIAGGESGPGARPMHPDWVRSLRDQCAAAGVPFFFKQWGEHVPCITDMPDNRIVCCPDGADCEAFEDEHARYPVVHRHDREFWRVGKRRAGNTLDGRQHLAFPA